MTEVKKVLDQIQFTNAWHEGTTQQKTSQVQPMPTHNEDETVQLTTLASQIFILTKEMLKIDQEMV